MRVLIGHKSFARISSHTGLGISAMNAAKSLRAAGIKADVVSMTSANDIRTRLAATPDATHFVISAPWIQTPDLAALCSDFPDVHFAVNCHSNLGFLQADPNAFRLVREGLSLQRSTWNFHMAANCQPLADWLGATYGVPALCLPNMYHVDNPHPESQQYTGGPLRIGVFGATRALKNHLSSCGAALLIARQLRAPLELHINSGRSEGAGPVLEAIRQMIAGVPGVTLVDVPWQPWADFRSTTAHMHLVIQASYTESFCVVASDAICGGVPVLGSPAIRWLPKTWIADSDDANHMATVGRCLLSDPMASRNGMAALESHNAAALNLWGKFLQLK